MSEFGYKIRNKEGIYFITFAVVEWIDVFSRRDYQDIIIDSLKFCQKEKGLIIYAWCLMTNHVHLIIAAKDSDLSEILRDFKKFTSITIIKAIESNTKESRKNWMLKIFKEAGTKNSKNVNFQFWRQENHPKELYSEKFMNEKLDYIHNNPVETGIVDSPENYLLSSAKNYLLNEEGLIDIDYL
ncbi:MAG: transposase [Bacteroidetes bacterium]|nr:transposase [Bacteroidota bacterium]